MKSLNVLFLISFVVLLTACGTIVPSVRDEAQRPGLVLDKPTTAAQASDGGTVVEEQDISTQAAQQRLQRDIDQLEERKASFNSQLADMLQKADNLPEAGAARAEQDKNHITGRQAVSFRFDDADLVEVVRLFMQELLQDDFILHDGVQGSVTMDINAQMTAPEIERLLQGLLQLNNMTMFYQDQRWHILPLEEAPRELSAGNLYLPQQQVKQRGQQIKAFRLDYIAVAELVKILTPYLSKGAQVYAHEATGIVLVSDYPHSLDKVEKLIRLFDVGPFAGLHLKVYWPKFVLADELIKELDALAKGLSVADGNPNSRLSFLALPRLNLLLTMTRDTELLDFVDMWVHELDREVPQVLQQNQQEGIYIYAVKNGAAADIVGVLEGLFGSGSETEPEPAAGEENLPTGTQLTRLSSGLEKEQSKPGKTHPDAVSGDLSGPVTFVVDEITNSVLVRSSSSDYQNILPVMKRLDAYPKQALIEVTIAEVQLDESSKLGIEWEYLMNNVAGTSASGNLNVESGLGIISGSGDSLIGSGLSYLLVNTNRFTAAIKAFSEQNRVNVLSSPHILASDNQEARIDIGDEVPIVTSEYRTTETASTATSVDKTIQYRDVGILLSVTPHIHDNGMVRMEVSQEVSEISNRTVEGVNSPLFSKRSANTSLSVRDGQTIVIGGLMKQTSNKGYSGVPVLGRLPLLRYLFGYEGRNFSNTELMIFITPHVILNEDDSTFISRTFLQRLDQVRAAMKF